MRLEMQALRRFGMTHVAIVETGLVRQHHLPGRVFLLGNNTVRVMRPEELATAFTIRELQRRAAEGLLGNVTASGTLRLRRDVLDRLKKDVSEFKLKPKIEEGSLTLTSGTSTSENAPAIPTSEDETPPVDAPALGVIEEMTYEDAALFEQQLMELIAHLVGDVKKEEPSEESKKAEEPVFNVQRQKTESGTKRKVTGAPGPAAKRRRSEDTAQIERQKDEKAAQAKKDKELHRKQKEDFGDLMEGGRKAAKEGDIERRRRQDQVRKEE